MSKPQKTETKEKKQSIEFETVTLKVPKNVLEYFRVQAKMDNETLEQNLEYHLVELCHSSMEGMSPDTLMEIFNVKPIFKEILAYPSLTLNDPAKE
jgi:hypothetical protein